MKLFLFLSIAALMTSEAVHGQQSPPPNAPEETRTVVDTSQATVEPSPRRSRRSRSSRKDIVMIGAPINVKEGETANSIVGIGSSIRIDGTVNGDVVSVLGKVKLGPNARVEKDLVIVGAGLEADPSAQIDRSPVVISPEGILGFTNLFPAEVAVAGKEWVETSLFRMRPLPLPTQSYWAWVVAGTCVLFYLLIELLFPKTVRTTVTALEERPGNAFMAGLLTSFLTVPVFLLLTISVVGIAVVPFGACALLGILMLGKTSVYHYAGQALTGRWARGGLPGSVLALLLGSALFYLAYCVPVLGALVWIMAGLMGVGAVMLTAFGRSSSVAAAPGIPVPGHPGQLMGNLEAGSGATAPAWPRAGFWIRLMATLLDLALVVLIVALVFRHPAWFPIAWLAYHLGFWIWRGTTIGGIICNLRIVRMDGQRLLPGVAVVRLLGSIFSLAVVGLGFFWAGWSADKQSWHDKIAGTTVIRLPRSSALL